MLPEVGSAIIVLMAERNEYVEKSAQNISDVKTIRAGLPRISADLTRLRQDSDVPLSALAVVNGFLAADGSKAEMSHSRRKRK